MVIRKKKFTFVSLRKRRTKTRKKSYLKFFLAVITLFVFIPSIIWYIRFKRNVLNQLTPISTIEKVIFSQTTTITDRNWVVLYKVFDENRKYVKLSNISQNMQNAIVAIEDKKFWTNPWIDIKWLIRAGIHDIFFWTRHWWSTLTQQLIKNLILTREKTITRKLKEFVLSLKLNSYLENKIKMQYSNLTNKQLKQKVKEKILEMYLNYVFYWNNAYWVEAASQTYFHKPASQLTILESAILSAIPKSPVKYDPLRNRINNIWNFKILNSSWWVAKISSGFKKKAQQAYIDYLKNQSFAFAKSEYDVLKNISPKNLKYKWYKIIFIPWRADIVLARMYVDWYIDKNQLIQAINESFNKKIYSSNLTIKAPWFVFYVLELLNKKYWEDIVSKAWWTIKTSLDIKIQELAQQSILDYSWYLLKKWANNASLLYINSKNWDILAYVWSKNYYDKSIDWNVDMIRAHRQCWSVMKPLIYANAFIKNKWFTPETPVYDTQIKDERHSFNNFDWKFLWLLPLKKALSYSRNIPAAKMYYMWWWEYVVKDFLKKIWLKTISDKIYYWYPLAIGAANVRMLDMAQAYSYLSNYNNVVKINPILEIRWPDWSLIYKKTKKLLPKIIPTWVVSMLWYILSNPENRPTSWNKIMQISWLTLATKSWTTNMVDSKTKKKYPRDGWFISYSPSKVFVVWAWNTDWKHMWPEAYWWWTAWKVWRDFILKLKDAGYIKNELMPLNWTTTVYINTINWKQASDKTPFQVSKKTIARINYNIPYDDGESVKVIKVDNLCNWLISKYTPKKDIITAYLINPYSLKPNNKKWDEPVKEWWKEKWIEKYKKVFNAPVFVESPDKICEDRKIFAEKWKLDFDIVFPKEDANLSRVFDFRLNIIHKPFKIKNIIIFVDWKKTITYNYSNPLFSVLLPSSISYWFHTISVTLKDEKWYTATKSINVNIVKNDKDIPYLFKLENSWNKFIYIFRDETSKVSWWYLYCNWDKIKFSGPIVKSDFNNCWYVVLDYYWNELNNK